MRSARWALATVALLSLAAAAAVLRRSAERTAPPPAETQLDVPPIPGEVSRSLAFGFRSLLADFTFLEAIQVLGTRSGKLRAERYRAQDRRLERLLDYSVEVDPKFAGAYRFAGTALPHETVDGQALGVLAAVSVLERGARERPDDWHIPFQLGFLQSYYLHDYARAAKNLSLATQAEGSPPYLGLLATRVAAHGGELETALQLAQTMLAQANEEETRREWKARVDALLMERDLRRIEAAALRYKGERGSFPPSLAALVAAGDLPFEPEEPHGGRYLLDDSGHARSTAAERLRVYGGAHLEVH